MFKKKEIIANIQHPLITEYEQAKKEYHQALDNFNNAELSYIDVSIYQLNAMKEKISILARQLKKEDINDEYTKAVNC